MAIDDKIEQLKNFLSPFVSGENVNAMLSALATGSQSLDELSIAVNKQLRISTSSGVYLGKNISEVGIILPPEIGISDDVARELAIAVSADKQILSLIQDILRIFYGEDATRGFAVSGQSEPYTLQEGMDLQLEFEDGEVVEFSVTADQFRNIGEASAQEVADVITRQIRNNGLQGFAQVEEDFVTKERFVKIYGSAVGPFSLVKVLGGRLQNQLEFPLIRATDLGEGQNNTSWQITKTIGNIHRFRWIGGNKPALDKIKPGDRVLMYGDGFVSNGFEDTFIITNVRPAESIPAVDAGYFEIETEINTGLLSSLPDQTPPSNTINETFSKSVSITSYDDLKFFLAKKNTPYSKKRYALAWEPAESLLKVYMPATTKLVSRELIGAAHVHALYSSSNLNGIFGHSTDTTRQVQIINERTLRYQQPGYDNIGTDGTIEFDSTSKEIDYVSRENFMTTVVLAEPHGITGVVGPDGIERTDKTISVEIANTEIDDPDNSFLGPYSWDDTVKYTLTSTSAEIREQILPGESKNTLIVNGVFPNEEGFVLFDLNGDGQEGPVRYLASQISSSNIQSEILNISQSGFTATINTKQPHGALEGNNISISGTSSFDGIYEVSQIVNSTTLVATSSTSQTASENNTGTITVLIGDSISTLILDPSYTFQNEHEAGSSISLLSDTKAYIPKIDGSDYSFYVTGTAEARVYGQKVINDALAAGVNVEIIVIYPDDFGLGNAGGSDSFDNPPASDKIVVWGPDDVDSLKDSDG